MIKKNLLNQFTHCKFIYSDLSSVKINSTLNKQSPASIYKTNSKTFFRIFRGTSTYDSIILNKVDYEKEKKNIPEEWYETQDTLVFVNKRYPLLKCGDKDLRMIKYFEWAAIFPILLFTGYKTIINLINWRYYRGVLWGVGFYFSTKIFWGARLNKKHFIYQIDLMEDGKTIELTLHKNKIQLPIFTVRRLTADEALYFANMLPDSHMNYIPIIINNQFYLIFKSSFIQNKEIFGAIFTGKITGIKLEDEYKINKEDAIDIDSK